MANRIIEALWDCPSCGRKGIGGRTKRCPGCGSPQDENVQFYMASEKKYLDEETAKDYGKGADWVCSYCGADNRYSAENCYSCGAPREEKKGNLGSVKKQQIPDTFNTEPKQPRKRRNILPVIAAILAIIIFFSWFTGRPRDMKANITDLSWSRIIAIEEQGVYDESGWSVPDGAVVYDRRQEVSGYNRVVDHYEDVQVRRSRQVISGYDTTTSYVNNNDGTFTEVTHQNPIYTTEYYYETERQPVYRQDPVYSTKYYYTIERWKETDDPVITEGSNKSQPYWGEVKLKDNQREEYREESFTVEMKTDKDNVYITDISESLWNQLNVGDSVDFTVRGNMVTEINGNAVN